MPPMVSARRRSERRRLAIIALLAEHSEVHVEQLSRLFETSEVTIRKDLSILENRGHLLRRYGGAIALPVEPGSGDPRANSPIKQAIARAAASQIGAQARIAIDSGHTTSALIPLLGKKKGLVVMTNAIHVAQQLLALEHAPTLLMTGGTWDPHSESFQGRVAGQVLGAYEFDQLFIGADGIDLDRGTTTFNELLGISQQMAQIAREVLVMVESVKFGRRIPNLELPWSTIDKLITDDGISAEQRRGIEARGPQVICAAVG